ncbi:MAG: 30S ribosomal protein S13 [Fimbriimonadales bacterium]|jgi:small subunit ribosomal protein S13|nr:30S ribosomal protein S13 [Fimbriimonadales bacterium]BCW96869.1 MAG: 30S ribosomal protein S13 [Fimbriimonadales bacterium]
MARIAGVDLPRDRKVEYALPVIFGIGLSSARKILQATGVDPNKRVRDLTEEEVAKLRAEIENNYTIEGDLRREQQMNIRRLIEIGCYRGMRHRRGLPVHGQRTRTNARTRKGPKKTVSTGKRKKAK